MLIISTGEPAGIGPEVVLKALAQADAPQVELVGDLAHLQACAAGIGFARPLAEADAQPARDAVPVHSVPLKSRVTPGEPDPRNRDYVLECLRTGLALCRAAQGSALVTAPIHKGVLSLPNEPFSGHTEWLGEQLGMKQPVMLLVRDTLRVCLATTHLPLAEVPGAITAERLEAVLNVLHADLTRLFGIKNPRIGVCGLNPHAGEGGHLGLEERDVIAPLIERLREQGCRLAGPLPADTAFTRAALAKVDAVLAMYHDQGLPVIKHAGFGEAVNVTLGLPIIRTSPDHGTALDIAGKNQADAGGMRAALQLAARLIRRSE